MTKRNYVTGFNDKSRKRSELEHFIASEMIGAFPTTLEIATKVIEIVIHQLNKLNEL